MATQITSGDINALITPDVLSDIIEGTVKQSAAMQMFRRLPNGTSNKMKMKVLDGLPTAYWVGKSNNGRKNLTKAAWDNKYINYAELAVIIPIKEDLFDDADIDIWETLKPRLQEAFGKKFDQAVFTGVDRPDDFRADLLSSIVSAGATVPQASGTTLYSAINDAMTKVEESGYNPNGIIGGVNVKGKFRMMLDTSGQPIKGTEIDELPKYYIDNGAWDKDLAQLIVGDFSQAVYSIRQDITFKILTEAIIQDPSSGDIVYNLAQDDMIALRAVMRIGWEIPNPINALNDNEATRFPFAAVTSSTATPTTYKVTATVKDNATTPKAIAGATVKLGGMKHETNSSGIATFDVADGTYEYEATASKHKADVGTVTVDGSAESLAITLPTV